MTTVCVEVCTTVVVKVVGVARGPPPSKAPIAIPTISPITASMPGF
ncbi:MAG: hypothetical protein ACO2OS_04955 [Thermosphaera aggregans]